jgi:type II secretory pathway predicted ATPase ExeA
MNMYFQRFGLAGPAFESGAPPAARFLSTPYRQAYAAMEWGLLHETSGFCLLVGEPGTGKTTLVNALVSQRHDRVHTVLIQNSRLRLDEIMSLIVEQLGCQQIPDTRLGLWQAIERTVDGLQPEERIVVIVDEAQSLDDARLEDLRLLSNCDGNVPRRLHFILAGQPELQARLLSPNLRNLNQRIGARAKLVGLDRNEAWDYVDYRLHEQGGSAEKIFQKRALRRLIGASGGILRQLNVLCTAAIACAHAQNERMVTSACASAAIAEFRDLYKPRRVLLRRFAAAGVVASATAIAAVAVAAVLAVRRAPAVSPVEGRMQFDPAIVTKGSISADVPAGMGIAKELEDISRTEETSHPDPQPVDVHPEKAANPVPSPANLPPESPTTVMASAAHAASGAPSVPKPSDSVNPEGGANTLGTLAPAPPPDTPATRIEASTDSPVSATAVKPRAKRHRIFRHVRARRSMDSESFRDEPNEPSDPSDSPPIMPDDSGGPSAGSNDPSE